MGYWYPNQIINGYNKAKQGIYENKKTSFFFSETIMPGSRHSFFPQLEKIYYNLASQAVVENIPIISLLFSIVKFVDLNSKIFLASTPDIFLFPTFNVLILELSVYSKIEIAFSSDQFIWKSL